MPLYTITHIGFAHISSLGPRRYAHIVIVIIIIIIMRRLLSEKRISSRVQINIDLLLVLARLTFFIYFMLQASNRTLSGETVTYTNACGHYLFAVGAIRISHTRSSRAKTEPTLFTSRDKFGPNGTPRSNVAKIRPVPRKNHLPLPLHRVPNSMFKKNSRSKLSLALPPAFLAPLRNNSAIQGLVGAAFSGDVDAFLYLFFRPNSAYIVR